MTYTVVLINAVSGTLIAGVVSFAMWHAARVASNPRFLAIPAARTLRGNAADVRLRGRGLIHDPRSA